RSGQTPRYRTDDSDWSEPDFSSPELLKDDSLALGALRDRDDDDDDDDDEAAFEAEVAARRRRGNGRRRPVRRGRPPGTLEDDEPTAPVEEHGRPPDLVTRLLTAAAVAVLPLVPLQLGRRATTNPVAAVVRSPP